MVKETAELDAEKQRLHDELASERESLRKELAAEQEHLRQELAAEAKQERQEREEEQKEEQAEKEREQKENKQEEQATAPAELAAVPTPSPFLFVAATLAAGSFVAGLLRLRQQHQALQESDDLVYVEAPMEVA